MEEGYLTIPLHGNVHSLKWNSAPEHSYRDDDIMYDPKQHGEWWKLKLGSVLPAHRCRECRCVTFYHP
jgi:hypothetical protein